MQFSRFIFSLVLMSLMACQDQEENSVFPPDQVLQIHSDSLVLRPSEGLVYYHGKPFSGSSIGYYSNGNFASQIDYLKGKKQGFYKKWYENGQISFESHYSDGKQDGMTYSWWRNGNKRSASTFSKGVASGKQLQWYTSGAKFKEINLVNGKEEGMQKSWRENGKIYNNYEAKNGRIFGLKRATLCYQLEDEVVQFKDTKSQ